MPTRKQRRRRAKEQRHEYVWEDDEGNELAPEEVPTKRADQGVSRASPRGVREPQPPSWGRTLKRGLIFAPIMFVTVMLIGGDLTLAGQLLQTAVIVAIFLPFSFFLDGVMYRSHKRRIARQAGSERGG